MVLVGPYYGGTVGSYGGGWNYGSGSVSDGSDASGRYGYGSIKYITYVTSAPTIPAGAIITAVKLYIRTGYGVNPHAESRFAPVLYVPGQSLAVGSYSGVGGFSTYSYTYSTNPCNGNAQWTQSDLNNLEIGAALDGYDGSHHTDLSEAYYYVEYVLPVGGQVRVIGMML